MTSGAVQSSDPLRDALRHYLALNPEAADGIVGIRHWWLPEVLRSVSEARLQQALDGLVAAGEMQVRSLPDGSQLYASAEQSAQ